MAKKHILIIQLSKQEKDKLGEITTSRKLRITFQEGRQKKLSCDAGEIIITEIKRPKPPLGTSNAQKQLFITMAGMAKPELTDFACNERLECLDAIEEENWWGMSCTNCPQFKGGGSTWEE